MPARDDPYAAYNFLVEIDGIAVAGFSEVSGLELESDVIEYRTGADDVTLRKLPGIRKFPNVMLKRGITGDTSLFEWARSRDRRNAVVVLLDDGREPVLRWRLRNAWPAKYAGPALNAKNSEVAIETLELVHEGLELEG
jgi:phage tail-like protein